MDRLQWSSIMLQDTEDFICSTNNVKIYDGDDKVSLSVLRQKHGLLCSIKSSARRPSDF